MSETLAARPSLSSLPTLDVPVDALVALPAADWPTDAAARSGRGDRLVTAFGRRGGERVWLTSVWQSAEGALSATRCAVDAAVGLVSATPAHPALHVFEREIHESTGLAIHGHPWLKPVRFPGRERAALDAYPFHRVEGRQLHEVAVGPVHAGVIEPGAFRFQCHGETVLHLEIQLGYQHRGVEALLRQRPLAGLRPLIETIAGDSSVAHGWAYSAAVEALASTESAAPGDAPRAMMLELERVGLHLASLAGLATDIGILQIAATYQRLRTGVINTTMRLSGSRFGRGAIRPFGSGARLGDGRGGLTAERLQRELALIARDADEVGSTFLGAATVRHRFAGTGVVDRAAAMEVGLVGLAARASGSPIDARASAGGVYAVEPIATTTASSGDCLARAQVRIDEVRRSLEWLSRMATREPLLSAARGPIGSIAPSRLAVVMCEGARGEVVHAIETGPDGETLQYKVQDPSLRNWTGLALAVRDNEISDFPICNKSFDLSYCGHDL